MKLTQMRRASNKMDLQWPRPAATSTVTCLYLPPDRSSLASSPLRAVARTLLLTQIPIAECTALSAPHLPRVRSLAAFGRRPWCSPLHLDGPSSETLNTSRLFSKAAQRLLPPRPDITMPSTRAPQGEGLPLPGRAIAIIRIKTAGANLISSTLCVPDPSYIKTHRTSRFLRRSYSLLGLELRQSRVV